MSTSGILPQETITERKLCSVCHELLAISEFGFKDRNRRPGLRNTQCKKCKAHEERARRVAGGARVRDISYKPRVIRTDIPTGCKACPRCGEIKPLSLFYDNKGACKECLRMERYSRKGGIVPDKLPVGFKRCSQCGAIKLLAEFGSNKHGQRAGKPRSECLDCARIRSARYIGSEQSKAAQRRYRERHPDKCRAFYRAWLKSGGLERVRDWQRNQYRTNHKYRLRSCITRSINNSLRRGKNGHRWERLVGFSMDELMSHLEAGFLPGMTWDNYGRGGWHIDHIRPVSSFSFSSYDDPEFKECWALSNLQPLWETDNLRKSNKWPG